MRLSSLSRLSGFTVIGGAGARKKGAIKQMTYTDDPVADFERYDAQRQRELAKLPMCSECGQPITDEYCFEVNDELICESCITENHRKWTDDYAS